MKKAIFVAVIYFLTLQIMLDISNIEALHLKFTKIKCNITDSAFLTFEKCRVKAVSRNIQYLELYVHYLHLPINNASLRFRFMQRANGYKPFLYDFVLNCDFLKHMDPVKKIVWGWINDVSNLNHSCPLTEDFEIKRLENNYMTKQLGVLPILGGDYALFVEFYAYNVLRYIVEFYATVS